MADRPDYEIDEEALYIALNFGITFSSLQECEGALRAHSAFMTLEKKAGKPHGEVVWHGMMQVFQLLLHQRDQLRAQRRHNRKKEYLWVTNIR